MKDWQRGVPLDRLRALAAPFKAAAQPYAHGAFGVPKERDIADALAEGRVAWTRAGDVITAAAIFRMLKTAARHSDFTGREIVIPPGRLLIGDIAFADPASGDRLLSGLLAKVPGRPVWAEIYQECEASRALLTRHGFVYAATKVMASSDLRALYCRDDRPPPALDPAEEATLQIVAPDWIGEDERRAILAEADAAAEWAQHYSSYNKRRSWTAYALRGFDPQDPCFIIKPAEMSKRWKAENPHRLNVPCDDTVAAARFPTAMRVVGRLGFRLERVRLMRLAARGELTRHADITDRDAGVADGKLARLHIPLRTSPAVRFNAWDARGRHIAMALPERSLCYLDQRKPHAVQNDDPAVDRIHLVIDAHAGPELRRMLV